MPINRGKDIILITGDGRSLPEDVGKFISWGVPHEVMAIGRSINLYPGNVQHWANVDGADSKYWAENLPKRNNGKVPIRHSLGELPGYDVDWEIKECPWKMDEIFWHGSSALFAVYACLELGYKKIVLAGCPLDSKGHWYFPPEHTGPSWTGETYQAWLDFARDERANAVRAMSGYTAQMLGKATKEFLNE